MRFFLISLLLLSFFVFNGCRPERTESYIGIPQDSVIDRTMMISMLVDVHVIEAEMQIERSMGVDPQKLAAKYYAALYSKFRVSEKRFRASMDYYKQDQGKFIKMYDEVIAEIGKRENNLKVEPKNNPEE